ncbi:DUF6928 family protein [Amycolatopsis sp. lyj-108]|uniref:DUF6928 family protein n=1 Tax=Amycolatopsis sp. lyj-108 TaxID=2789286 RepID=UPI00397A6EFE
MGSKSAILVLSDVEPAAILRDISGKGQAESKALAERIAGSVSSDARLLPLDLAVWPEPGVVCVSSVAGLQVICSRGFITRTPSELTRLVGELAPDKKGYAVLMDSAEDWTAFAVWSDGRLQRSLSVDPEYGVVEELGDRLNFEGPFWEGVHSVQESAGYPLPFHPIDLGNKAMREFFGFILEGREDVHSFDPEDVEIWAFRFAD